MSSLEDLPLRPGDPECPVRDILDHIGDKWSMLVISNLAAGSLRFSEIKRKIGKVSQRMLTETVRSLERDGILLRTVSVNMRWLTFPIFRLISLNRRLPAARFEITSTLHLSPM